MLNDKIWDFFTAFGMIFRIHSQDCVLKLRIIFDELALFCCMKQFKKQFQGKIKIAFRQQFNIDFNNPRFLALEFGFRRLFKNVVKQLYLFYICFKFARLYEFVHFLAQPDFCRLRFQIACIQ